LDFSFTQFGWLLLISASLLGVILGFSSFALLSYFKQQRSNKNVIKHQKILTSDALSIHDNKKLRSERLIEVYKSITDLTSTLNYKRVLDTALDLSTFALSSFDSAVDGLVSVVLLFTKDETLEPFLQIAASRRLTRSDIRNTFPAQEGILKNTIDEGGTLITDNVSKDPELWKLHGIRICNSAYSSPLRHGLDTYGVLLHCHPDPNFFTPERYELLDLIGNQAMVAIQNARLYRDLEQEKERMMEIQDEARKKLARDLHDGPTQSVAAVAMRINIIRRLMEQDPIAAAEELQKIEDLARKTTKETRHMLFTLRPLVLESDGLTAALEAMAEKMKETFDHTLILDVDRGIEIDLEIGKQGVLFAIVEEAVNNARKYANANHIWVRLKFVQDEIARLEVQDDGIGFDIKATDAYYVNSGSFGLVNMRERTELVDGIFSIDSEIGSGTSVKILFPLSEEANERLHQGG